MDVPAGLEEDPRLDAYTWYVGARLQARPSRSQLGVHARAGLFWRNENDIDVDGVAQDQGGWYWGGGLDWWFTPSSSLTFFALRLEREEDGLEETAVGLSARFHVGRSWPSSPWLEP